MSQQKNDLPKEFIKQELRHGGSYTDLFEIKLVRIVERIMAHFGDDEDGKQKRINHVQLVGLYQFQYTAE